MTIAREENTHKLAEIWLRCSLQSHNFIDSGYWKGNLTAMRDTYLPSSENYSSRETDSGEIRGFISLRGGHIEALFVDIPYQGKGIGSRLLEFAKGRHPSLTVTVYAKNERAVRFYTANGFTEKARKIDLSTGEQEIDMEYKKHVR